jgi:chorismate mutase
MTSDYLFVNKKILPGYLDKVILARDLLESHEVETITEAVQRAGISRNTYYKYKDYVFSADSPTSGRHVVLSMILKDEAGVLNSVLTKLSELHASVLTISQALPVAHKANVLISLDISKVSATLDELTNELKQLPHVRSVHMDAMD